MEGRVAIVTGATAGIGAAAALLFAEKGARVILAGRRDERGAEMVAKIKEKGGEALFVRADMASDSDIKAMVGAAVSAYGRVDFAFNNAGMFLGGEAPLHDYSDEMWHAAMAVNLTGVYRCMKHEIAAMLETGAKHHNGAAIVNNASTVGHRGSDRSGPAYTATKHAVIGLTRQAAISYVRENIRVNAVSPGPTLTEVTGPLLEQAPDVMQGVIDALCPRGHLSSAEEVAEAAVFLCSTAAGGITGHSLPIDGGQLAKL